MSAFDDCEFDFGQVKGEESIHRVWPDVWPWFAAACRRSPTHLSPQLILDRVIEKKADLWLIYHKTEFNVVGAFETYLREEDDGDVFVLETGGGIEIKKWGRQLLAELEKLAVRNGVKAIEIEGRRGWQRFLPDYTLQRVIIGKDLRHGRRGQQ